MTAFQHLLARNLRIFLTTFQYLRLITPGYSRICGDNNTKKCLRYIHTFLCYVSILCREHAVVKVCVGLGTKNTLLGLEKDHVCLQVIPNILSGFI